MPTTLPLESAAASTNIKLTQTRVIRASRAKVYEAWTNPEVLMKWFGSATMYCAGATMDVRVGGEYRLELAQRTSALPAADGAGIAPSGAAVVGHYTKVVPQELVQFTWSAAWSPDEESLLTVSLQDVAEGTEVTVVQERFKTEASRDGHNSGWTGGLENLAKLLEG